MGTKMENKIHVSSKLFIAVDIKLLGIVHCTYVHNKPFIDKEQLLSSYQKHSFRALSIASHVEQTLARIAA